jgi:Domain of unknown function (DUF4375)
MSQEPEYSSKIKHLFEVVKIYDDVPTFLESIEGVPHPLLVLYAAHFCLSEVHNGGFLQLFWNSTGVLLPEAVDGYKALGMPKLAGTFSSAATCLGSSYPRNREDRWDALLQASERTEDELTAIFQRSEDLYLGYQEATATLPCDALDKQAWELAKSEDGGFQERAVTYVAMFGAELNKQ